MTETTKSVIDELIQSIEEKADISGQLESLQPDQLRSLKEELDIRIGEALAAFQQLISANSRPEREENKNPVFESEKRRQEERMAYLPILRRQINAVLRMKESGSKGNSE